MIFKLLADLIVIIHFIWIVFLVFGVFAGRRHRFIKFIHISGLTFALMLQVFGWYCPLTYLEVWLREQHDPTRAYAGSYIIHYLETMIYIEVDRWVVGILTIVLFGMTIWIYHRWRRV